MVKLFSVLNADKLEPTINDFLKKNPNLEITAISHANVVKTGIFSWFQWNALVVFKVKNDAR